ncbi:AAA family ATPase [Amycolatopsis panacis]|uniref:Adenylyl-sulfate kinase n=1 Tax=Amycolatopsis panacis TaxID=2340917 RepID=A0A419I299_9PSEU|nr:AAA family ATPase [Amycolatopsis panacis]RJQ83987.1 adenylyl-sulfate kinase [Amycolatopsis panacis]
MAARSGLILLSGLPGTGKSTIAAPLARALRAAYLRIDTIEQTLVESGELAAPPRTAGYLTGYALAGDQLGIGVTVVAECVNPLKITRDAWARVAGENAAWLLEVELICSDPTEHRSRVENRRIDIPGLTPQTWRQVLDREYEAWDREHLIIDTAIASARRAADIIVEQAAVKGQTPLCADDLPSGPEAKPG